MAVPTVAYTTSKAVTLAAPALQTKIDALDAEIVQGAIDEAAALYAQMVAWKNHTKLVALVALHLLGKSGALGGGLQVGPVISASAGGVSQSVGVQAVVPGLGPDMTTPWGQRALTLLKGSPPSARVGRGGFSPWL